ncbi:spore germination protein KB [Paenibacillus algorifonticola]|uniref:Spore germination protein KB n=1 Tax=Paenibacillus algorifonticola TaxID=684063 RepID=A0A1I2IM49_9BACL|nr:endospore germination permease [Paenibacillus algorifonticola]SFF42713.1 spore germination protein KB [Paenibacillus algorifonticola]
MRQKENVSPKQMGVLFFTYMTGSSIINIPSPLIGKAGSDAWLSLLISGGLGMGLLVCMLFLYRRYPSLTYVEYSRRLIGVWPTAILSLLPLSFILQMVTGIVLDIGLFMQSSMMRGTPVYAFSLPILMVAALTVRAGIEVMARMFAIIIVLVICSVTVVLLLSLENYNWGFLIPVMPHGIKPLLHGAFFSFGFPYAEIFLFAMLLPFVRERSSGELNRTMFIGLIWNIITLCISIICTIMMFGPLAGVKKYSLFEVARTVEVQEIISRIESVMGMSLIAGSYMKATITLYVLSLYVSQLFKLKNYKVIAMPLALVAFLNILVGFKSDMDWTELVSVVHPLWVSVSFVFPLLLITLVALFRKPPS